jgi:hypothetical protein
MPASQDNEKLETTDICHLVVLKPNCMRTKTEETDAEQSLLLIWKTGFSETVETFL